MKTKTLDKSIRTKLAKEGVSIAPGSRADRGIKITAKAGATVVNTGSGLLKRAEKAVSETKERLRASIHNATEPKK